MKIGDLVILKKGHYNIRKYSDGHSGVPRLVWTDHLGVITDARRHSVDGTAEYKVYTADNKHSWEHRNDLRIPD